MDPDQDVADGQQEDVDMITLPQTGPTAPGSANGDEGLGPWSGALDGASDLASDPQRTPGAGQELPIRGGETCHPICTDGGLAHRANVPPLAEQIHTIQNLVQASQEVPVQEGDNVYLISKAWLATAQASLNNGKNVGKGSDDGALGPVDNSDIIQASFTDAIGQEFVKLKPGLGLDHFELFPKDAWDLLMVWHGLVAGQRPIVRTAHNTNPDTLGVPNIQYEFYPPVFSIHRIWSAASPLPIEQELKQTDPAPPLIVHSTSYRLHDFLMEAKRHAGVGRYTKVRLWRILQTLPAGSEESSTAAGLSTPPRSPGPVDVVPGSFPKLLVEVDKFLKLEKGHERDIVDAHDSTHHDNYNGSRSLAMTGLTVDQALVLDECTDKKKEWVSTCVSRGSDKGKGVPSRGSSGSLAAQNKSTDSGRDSPVSGPTTRGRSLRQAKSGKTLGCVGLQNLGNTCYMNSALQCVRSVEELTKYFLTREAEKEINPGNLLGHNGDVARAYGKLLVDIYSDPPPSSLAPRQFKNVIGRYAPSFSGYGQQDSQEFLGFLLDGLQEDLSRITKKPYIEKPDSTDEMIGNPAAIRAMANEVWDITKRRDDSVIADLFTGLYQSTLVCPVCSKISITFDPFNNLTLPLPLASVWTHTVRFYPLNDLPVDLTVELDKTSSIKALKEFVSARVGVPFSRLMAGEEWKDKFFKFYEERSSVSEVIGANDHPVVHELEAAPSNLPLAKIQTKQKYRSLLEDDEPEKPEKTWEEAASKQIVVPVIHRLSSGKTGGVTVPPHFIVLTTEEARSEDVIRRKVLEKVATFSTYRLLHEEDSAESTEPELVNAPSDGDSQSVAKSVEGDEELVDVTMKDANSSPAAAPAASESPLQLKKFNPFRPKFIDPQQFLDPQLQNLFELSYFAEGEYNIPVGWNALQNSSHKTWTRLSTRLPPPAPSDVEMNSPAGTWDGSEDSTGDEILDSQSSIAAAATRMADESSDSASDIPSGLNSARFRKPSRLTKAAKGRKVYGKAKKRVPPKQAQNRNNNSYLRQNESSEPEENAYDGGPLVRLGEGLVVDWSDNTYYEVFGGRDSADHEGMPTFADIEQLEDEVLKRKQERRNRRRRDGISLDDCLAEFEKEEVLSEQDTWYCPRCKEHRRATKKFDLWKTPDILAVHLKRFSSSGYRREKLDVLVDFPIEGLDLTSRVIDKEDGKQEIYDLFAVDDHWGGLGGGHYTAFAKNFFDGEWYSYNDTSVSKQKDVSKVVTSAAYLLFYRRRSAVPLGGPKFQQIFERFDSEAQQPSDSESGEGRRLGSGSSPRGSPSALLTGAGATHRNTRVGLASGSASGAGPDHQSDDDGSADNMLPDYGAAKGNPGFHSWQNPLETTDEGIDMPEWADEGTMPVARRSSGDLSDVVRGSWSFANLPGSNQSSGGLARSEADDDNDSTTAQNDNTSSLADDMADEEGSYAAGGDRGQYPRAIFSGGDAEQPMLQQGNDGTTPVEPGGDYVLPDEPSQHHHAMFDNVPPPSYDDAVLLSGSGDVKGMTMVTAEQIAEEAGQAAEHVDEVAGDESRVTEIRLDDDDDDDKLPDARGSVKRGDATGA